MNSLLQNTRNLIALGAVGVAALLAAGWFLVVAPQRDKASGLEGQVAAAQQELDQRREALASPSVAVKVKASDLYRLNKALPDTLDMPGVLLDISSLAGRHKLEFTSVLPGAPELRVGYTAQPLAVVLQGRFGDVSRFLRDLRSLVRVRQGRLDSRGRTYSASGLTISAPDGERTFPFVKAEVTVESYTFQAQAPGAAPTPEPDTTDAASGTVAAGVIP